MPIKKGIFGRGTPKVNIERDFYTMASDGNEAEIIMYGEIVQERPKHWWTEEPLEGNYIVLDEFLEDLERVAKSDKVTIRLNSVGGDAFAAIPIHNRLRELKGEVTAIVDGVAMSGGSLIMCAADHVQVNASSLIMIHLCWVRPWGAYNANELRKMATASDAVDKAQAAIYKRKTGMSEEEILALMADETYMTGTEALEKGFADEILEGEAPQIVASADLRTLYVNDKKLVLGNPLMNLPENIPMVKSDIESVKTNKNEPAKTGGEGGKTMAKSLEELRAENPELANKLMAEAQAAVSHDEAVNEAVEAERRRIAEIDEIATLYDDELVREAKFDKPCSAQELAFAAAKKAAQQGKSFLEDLDEDYKVSGAKDVNASSAPGEEPKTLTPEQRMAQGREQAKKMSTKEEN